MGRDCRNVGGRRCLISRPFYETSAGTAIKTWLFSRYLDGWRECGMYPITVFLCRNRPYALYRPCHLYDKDEVCCCVNIWLIMPSLICLSCRCIFHVELWMMVICTVIPSK